MKIVISDHAKLKLEQRNLPIRLILQTAAHPDFMQPSYSGRWELFKRFGHITMKVVTVRTAQDIVIVTAHWIAKPRKKR